MKKEGKTYLDGLGERGFSLAEIKKLKVADKITFHFSTSLIDGIILGKEEISNGDTSFTIGTEKGVLKKTHRNLKVYKIY